MLALGIAMLLQAGYGVAPFDVLNTGVAEATGWSFTPAYWCVATVYFTVGRLLGGQIGWASVAGTLVIGPLIDVFRDLLPDLDGVPVRGSAMVAAILLLAIAVCLVLSTELGAGPTEVLMLGLIRRGLPIVAARWIVDGVPFVVGMALGGAIGVATVILAVGLGPLIKVGLRLLRYTPPAGALPIPATADPAGF